MVRLRRLSFWFSRATLAIVTGSGCSNDDDDSNDGGSGATSSIGGGGTGTTGRAPGSAGQVASPIHALQGTVQGHYGDALTLEEQLP